MRQLNSHFSLSASALAASLLVAACGGGGSSAPSSVAGSSGFAVDGYLSGATILCDTDADAEPDAGEDSTTTDTSGFFRFNRACSAGLVATGGTSTDTSLPFRGKLKAPPGSTMITPLTTLLSNGMTLDRINTALGLPAGTDVTSLDPARQIAGEYQRADLFRKTLAIQQILQKTAETLANVAGAGASAALPAIYSEVAAAMATQLRANPALLSGNALDTVALTSLVNAAATRVATSPALSAGIRTGLAGVNPASLAEVIAGALKVQTDRILQSTNAQLVGTTTTAQSDTRIADFALQNKGALAAAPGGAITTLATSIASTVSGGIAPPPPPPPSATGTLIVSFDETVLPNLGAFGDSAPSIATPPAGGTGAALKLDRSGALNFGGTFFNVASPIPFAANRKTVTARVYSTRANAVVYLKVEAAGGVATEVAATTSAANTWQTLTWVLSGVTPANAYSTVVFSADTDVPGSGAQTYWVDEVTLADAPVSTTCATSTQQCISFSESTLGADLFGNLVAAGVVNDMVTPTNKVLRIVKGPGGEPWAGATIYTMGTLAPALTIDAVGLGTSRIVTLRSRTAAPIGTKITLKFENAIDPTLFLIAEATTTKQDEWEQLTFDFASPTNGVFASTTVYNKASILPSWSEIPGTSTKPAADTEFFFDELKYAVATASPPPPPPPPPPAPGPATPIVTFDETPPLSLGAFGDAAPSIAIPPAGGTGAALRLDRSGGQNFGGTFFTVAAPIPFGENRKTVTARVYSTRANAVVYLKVEAAGGIATEVSATTGAANTWQTLTWVLSGVNPTNSYNVVVFSADTNVMGSGAQTYWIDEVALETSGTGGGGGGGSSTLPITFDGAGVAYAFSPFEGARDAAVVPDPAGGPNMVGSVIRNPGGPWYGGVTVSTGPNQSIATIPFTASAKTMSMRVFSPAAGMRVRMKVENANDGTVTSETDAVTVGTGWEVLTFNFANPGLSPPVTGGPTAPLNVAQTYNKVTLFFNVAAAGDAWSGTYYFDDIGFGVP